MAGSNRDDRLYKIQLPNYTDASFGSNLQRVFENIDSNFQKLANLGLTSGAPGKPSVWVPFNLAAALMCTVSDDNESFELHSGLDSSFNAFVDKIETSYSKYYEITEKSRIQYLADCLRYYDAMLDCIPYDEQDGSPVTVSFSNGTGVWKQRWEEDLKIPTTQALREIIAKAEHNSEVTQSNPNIDYSLRHLNLVVGNVNNTDAGTNREVLNQYKSFIPGDLMVSGNIANNLVFSPILSSAFIYIDPRFRNVYSMSGDAVIEDLQGATDNSCVIYGKLPPSDVERDEEDNIVDYLDSRRILEFEYVQAFPTIHVDSTGNFYLSVNGIDTNIPLSGKDGQSGATGGVYVVIRAEKTDEGPMLDTSKSGYYHIQGNIGPYVGGAPVPLPPGEDGTYNQYDNQTAFIFPDVRQTASAQYKTCFWIGHLTATSEGVQAYCGPENLVEVDLYDHSFANAMMGLDPCEVSVSKSTGNTPWFKPRGLMLPIGSRKVDSTGFADILFGGTSDSVAEPEHFSAHIFYSKKSPSSGVYKKEIHLSSINDYRFIGKPDDNTHGTSPDAYPGTHNSSILTDTSFWIDEPTSLTWYNNSSDTSHNLLDVYGGQKIYGRNGEERISLWDEAEAYGLNSTPGDSYDFGVLGSRAAGVDNQWLDDRTYIGLIVDYGIEARSIYSKVLASDFISSKAIKSTGSMYARHFVKKGDYNNSSQKFNLLMANGWATNDNPIILRINDEDYYPTARWRDNQPDDNALSLEFEIETSDRMQNTYIGQVFSLAKNQTHSDVSETWSIQNIAPNGYRCNWLAKAIGGDKYGNNFNLGGQNLASPSTVCTYQGLFGVVLVCRNKLLTTVRVLVAVNGDYFEGPNSARHYGLPIAKTGGGLWEKQTVIKFDSWKIGSLPGAIEYPEMELTQYWGGMNSRKTYHPNEWELKGAGDYAGPAVTCKINENGEIILGGTDVWQLFSTSKADWSNYDSSNRKFQPRDYLEFDFIYPTPEEAGKTKYYFLLDASRSPVINQQTGALVGGSLTQGVIASNTQYNQVIPTAGDVQDDNYSYWSYGNTSQTSTSDLWAIVQVETTSQSAPTTTTNNNPKIKAVFRPIQYAEGGGGTTPDTPTTNTLQPYNWQDADIVAYLTRLGLKSDITQMFTTDEPDMTRWDGPHGSVSVSDTGTTKRLTVECWDSMFENFLFKAFEVTTADAAAGQHAGDWIVNGTSIKIIK